MFITKRVARIVAKILSYIIFFVTLISAYGGYCNPAVFTLPAMALLFFPYFATLTLIISTIWLIMRRYVVGCIGVATLLACGPTFTEAVPLKFHNSVSNEKNTFTLVTFNSLHLQDIRQPDSPCNRSLSYLISCGADFVCIQELYGFGLPELPPSTTSQVDSLFKEYPHHSKDGWRELEFLSKYPFKTLDFNLPDGTNYSKNFVCYKLNIEGHELVIANIHLPSFGLSEADRDIITELAKKDGAEKSLQKFEGSVYRKMRTAFRYRAKIAKGIAEVLRQFDCPVIVCGDFNDVPGSWAYRNFTKEGFQDAYANTGFGHLITYNQHLMLFHIDQVLYRGEILPIWVKKGKLNASDHYPLEAKFEFVK